MAMDPTISSVTAVSNASQLIATSSPETTDVISTFTAPVKSDEGFCMSGYSTRPGLSFTRPNQGLRSKPTLAQQTLVGAALHRSNRRHTLAHCLR